MILWLGAIDRFSCHICTTPASPREGAICIYEDLKANVHLTGFRMILSVK